jgi:hypothetical protein
MIPNSKLDAVQVDPTVLPPACNVVHLSVRKNIYALLILVVVEAEYDTLVRAAVLGQSHDRVPHPTSLDQTTNDAETAVLSCGGSFVP